MNDDQLARQIDELERALERDDPSLAKRFDKLQRANTRNDVAVFSLLAISAVLLAVAFTTLSAVTGLGGVAAYLASFLVDTRYQRRLGGPPNQDGQRRPRQRHRARLAAATAALPHRTDAPIGSRRSSCESVETG
jgi:hypothetical protein